MTEQEFLIGFEKLKAEHEKVLERNAELDNLVLSLNEELMILAESMYDIGLLRGDNIFLKSVVTTLTPENESLKCREDKLGKTIALFSKSFKTLDEMQSFQMSYGDRMRIGFSSNQMDVGSKPVTEITPTNGADQTITFIKSKS